jgi:hypothetical protein
MAGGVGGASEGTAKEEQEVGQEEHEGNRGRGQDGRGRGCRRRGRVRVWRALDRTCSRVRGAEEEG